jgi:hypothetical protein
MFTLNHPLYGPRTTREIVEWLEAFKNEHYPEGQNTQNSAASEIAWQEYRAAHPESKIDEISFKVGFAAREKA